jgi:5'(3')-deoxyribonucleotidase
MSKITIAVNLDSTLNNLHQLIDLEDSENNNNLHFDDLSTREKMSHIRYKKGGELYDALNTPSLYEDLVLKDEWTLEAFEYLCNNFEVIIVSSCSNKTIQYKLEWIKKFLPFFNTSNFYSCPSKTFIEAQWLIDDGSRILSFEQSSILIDAHYNRHVDEERGNCRRMNNWKEIKDFFVIVKTQDVKSLSLT